MAIWLDNAPYRYHHAYKMESEVVKRDRNAETEQEDKKTTEGSELFSVDREKTCPFLLRVFCNESRHHRMEEFSRGNVPSNELQIYTWMDCTLKELMSLIREVNPETRQKGTLFSFSTVYPDMRRGGYRLKDLGQTCSGRRGSDDAISLYSRKFQIGDYIDVAVSSRPTLSRTRDRPY